ncbi:hypothetical protein LL058_34860 (plasmid) [Streptomyces clavuligerus]|nr:hypothetical protein [Streptomyces clavuligerus]WDN57614.1 hypothetical protein LL058_34860 [Streptomyces clavuligerus]
MDPTSGLAVSVLLSLVSAVAYAGGAIVQERVAATSPEGLAAALRTPGWWTANGLNGIGALLHVVALAYGPLSVVQPLGALTIVFALPLVALSAGRRPGAAARRGAAMATAGLAGLLALTGSAGTGSLATADRLPLACASFAAVAALAAAARAARRHPVVRSALFACAAGAAYGVSSVFTKAAAVDWAAGETAGALLAGVVILGLAAAGTVASQTSYRGAGLAAPLAVVTVVNPVVAAGIGMAFFGESFRYGALGPVLALGAGAVVAGGLALLTRERVRSARGPEPTLRPVPVPVPVSVPVRVPVPVPVRVSVSVPAVVIGSTAVPSGPVPVPAQVPLHSPVLPVLASRPPAARPVPRTAAPTAFRARVVPPAGADQRSAHGRAAVVRPAAVRPVNARAEVARSADRRPAGGRPVLARTARFGPPVRPDLPVRQGPPFGQGKPGPGFSRLGGRFRPAVDLSRPS